MTSFPEFGAQPRYLQSVELDEALSALAGAGLAVLAGGTDFYAAHSELPIAQDVLDISGIACLRGIERDERWWRLGALTTWRELCEHRLPPVFGGLKTAAREVGGMQVQNRGTLGGNVCNASPAADGVPPLLALDACVELQSTRGCRRLGLAQFVLGNRLTARRADELLTAVLVPVRSVRARSSFRKLGARRYLVISVAMVALTLETDPDGRVCKAAVAVGACNAAAVRLNALEARLTGLALRQLRGIEVLEHELAPLAPRDDVRGTAQYRREAVRTLIVDALQELIDE